MPRGQAGLGDLEKAMVSIAYSAAFTVGLLVKDPEWALALDDDHLSRVFLGRVTSWPVPDLKSGLCGGGREQVGVPVLCDRI